MGEDVRFCRTSDGVSIAYAVTGSGPPLVRSLGWFTHLEFEAETPYWSHINEELSRAFTLIRYDGRGMGLSDRDVTDFSLDAKVGDLESVVDAVGLDSCALIGVSEGGPTAVSYAVRHPERVKQLMLYGTTPDFAANAKDADWPPMDAVLTLVRQGWGSDVPAARQFFTGIFLPDAVGEPVRLFTELQRRSAAPDTVATMMIALGTYDVREEAKRVTAPTLVIHRRGDAAVGFEGGRSFAQLIPNARFVAQEGRNHVPLPDEPQTAEMIRLIIDFGGGTQPEVVEKSSGAASGGLVTILFTDIVSSTALTQSLGDAKAQDLVRRHNSAVRDALKGHGGSEIKHTGDGIMASFPAASGALAAAVAIQRRLAEENTSADTPLNVRIGLSAGEPLAEEGDLYGATVQLAARVCDRAEAGQIIVSNVVRELSMGKGFTFADLGDFVPKGFEDAVRVYEVNWT